ncbi:MAG: protein kinase, partial [Planctomycetes bacterium]|nr:protein kinase [Planctomycetota bacterium]
FEIPENQKLVVGRGEGSATKLRDPTVSRTHCQVEIDSGQYRLTNLGTASSTLVNGRRITTHDLQPGDLVRVGDTEMRFLVEGAVTGPAVTPAAQAAEPLSELIGTALSHYQITRTLAKGSSGMVFQGIDTEHSRPVALKVLWPEFSKNEEEMKRFVRAMKTMMPIRHENLVTLYGAGKAGQYCWIAMEYVDGESLTEVIHRLGISGKLSWETAFRVAIHIARALEVAHEHQIIHRNVTPQNILMRTSDGCTKLGDLMLAKALEGTLAEQITRQGQMVGDIVYMSPERTHGSAGVDCRSDIYGLGAMLYALLTGRPPFEGGTLMEAVSKIRCETPVRPKKYQLAIPDFFEDAVMKMLAKKPEDRFQTPAELLGQLERIAKFQHRAVWDTASRVPVAAAASQPACAPDPDGYSVRPQGSVTVPQATRPVAAAFVDEESRPSSEPPTTHFFRNILTGLLDEDSGTPHQREALAELVGKTLYEYEIKRILAKGHSGLVFYAERPAKNLAVALKVLWPDLAQRTEESQRFIRAVKTMLPIHHPNIVTLYDAGKTDGYLWMAMEYVKGASLTQVIRRIGSNGMLDWTDTLRVAIHIGRALEAAFGHQIIHRNITPHNILVRSSDNLAKLGDLMLAKALEGRLAVQVTGQGELTGDLAYMSPERTRGNEDVDHRSDIYSLGATLYTLLTGHPPFESRSFAELISRIRKGPALAPRQFQPATPELFERIVLKMLAKDPADRYGTPNELLGDLGRIAESHRISV